MTFENKVIKAIEANIVSGRMVEVLAAYDATRESGPDSTVRLLARQNGLETAAKMVAEMVNMCSEYDGRIYDSMRRWAASIPEVHNHKELEELGFYDTSSWIHSTHLNQLAMCMAALMNESK